MGVCGSDQVDWITTPVSSSPLPTVIQSFCGSGARVAVTQAVTAGQSQQPNPCNPTVIQGLLNTCVCPRTIQLKTSIEENMATGSMAAAGRSPNKHPRTGSEDSVDIAALLDRAADRFSACMDTKVDSMMDRLEKRIDEKIDSKLVL